MSAIFGSLGKILGLVDNRIDLGAITGILGRVRALADKARALASKFKNDPELAAFLNDASNLLNLGGGKEITQAEIDAIGKHWKGINRQQVHDRPAQPAPDRPSPPAGAPNYWPSLFPPPMKTDGELIAEGYVPGRDDVIESTAAEGVFAGQWAVYKQTAPPHAGNPSPSPKFKYHHTIKAG